MAEKERERWHLSLLQKALPEMPQRKPDGEPEPPDFLYYVNGRRLGVELTVFYLPPELGKPTYQAQRGLQKRAVARAEELHRAWGGPALYVSVHFGGPIPGKSAVEDLARSIARCVLTARVPRSLSATAVQVAYDRLPDPVSEILIRASVDGIDRLWTAPTVEWVAPIRAHHIREVIRRKASSGRVGRRRCEELWLVIVTDVFSHGKPSEISEEVLESAYDVRPFERVILLDAQRTKATHLRSSATFVGTP